MKNKFPYIVFIFGIFIFPSCKDYMPKPKAYPYIEIPEPAYSTVREFSEFEFQISGQGKIQNRKDSLGNQWFDIFYPDLNASIHCSYIPVSPKKFAQFDEESRNFVYFHIRKARKFSEQYFENPGQGIYGQVYRLEGDVASPIQFTLTDSLKSFFRGALYFNTVPNRDSIAPVIDYLDKDIQIMVDSFRWKI